MSFKNESFTYIEIIGFVILMAALFYIIFTKDNESCQQKCFKGYSYLVCKDGVVQMMEGDGDDILLLRCNEQKE